jgi:O-antigen/teichoic acid export membrane protein
LTSPPAARQGGHARERLDAGLYFAGTLFQRISLFLAVPFLLRTLSTAEYGAFGLLQSAVNLLPALVSLNLPATVTRLFFDGASTEERRAIGLKLSVLSAGTGLIAAFAVWICAAAARHTTALWLGVIPEDALLATSLVLIGSLGSNHLQVAWGIWRAENRALQTAIANTVNGLLFLAAITALAVTHRLGVISAVGAYAGAMAVIGLGANVAAIAGSPSRGGASYRVLARHALHYGLPLLPYLLALWGLAAGGRWIARAILTLEDTGRFTLASQLAIMVGLIGRSAYDAWAPRSFEMFASSDVSGARSYLRARGRLTLGVVAGAGAVTAVVVAVALPRFAPAYAGVASLFPLLALAPLFDVAYMTYHTELMGLKLTQPIGTYTTITVLGFVAAGVIGAKLFGLWGLAGAYVAAYAGQWLLARRAVRRARAQPATRAATRSGEVLPRPSHTLPD